MAFIPDNAFEQRLADKISPVLWEFYQYLCIKRNHETRKSSGKVDAFIQLYGYKRASKFNLIKELKTSNWITGSDGDYELLVGDFECVNEAADRRKSRRVEQSKKMDSPVNQSKNLDSESKKIDYQSKKIDSHIRNIPASSSSNDQQEEIHTNALAQTFPLKPLYDAFPDLQITPAQAGSIQAEVKSGDEAAWLATIKTYKDNHNPARNYYLPEKVGNLLGVFEKKKRELEKTQNGAIQPYGNGNQAKSTDAGTRNAARVSNTRTAIDELRRQGAEEQALSGGRNGTG
jgi:hypothetical protein